MSPVFMSYQVAVSFPVQSCPVGATRRQVSIAPRAAWDARRPQAAAPGYRLRRELCGTLLSVLVLMLLSSPVRI